MGALRLALVCLLLLGLAQGCVTRDYVTGLWTINRFDEREEVDLGMRQSYYLIASAEQLRYTVDPDDTYTRVVRRVVHRLLSVPENRARMPAFPWEARVLGSSDANAWCFPGGQLIVLTGLMRSGFVQNEDELAAILGHELAHAAARHGTEKVTMDRLRAALGPLARFVGPGLVELLEPEDSLAMAASLGRSEEEHDQAQELEADLIGLELMARAGYDPAKAPDIWARRGGEPTSGTHPPNRLRMQELLRHVPTAQWLARYRTEALPSVRDRWQWHPEEARISIADSSMSAQGPLPRGPRVSGPYVRDPPDGLEGLLTLSVRWRKKHRQFAQGNEVIVDVKAAPAISEDRLPISGILWVEAPGQQVLWSTRLWHLDGLEPKMERTVALPRLPKVPWRVRARALVGSLWVDGGGLRGASLPEVARE